jgi:hypothetical protein
MLVSAFLCAQSEDCVAEPHVQNLKNHVRRVPIPFTVGFLLIFVNLLWSVYALVTGFSVDRLMTFFTLIALAITTSFARTFALRVQDRVVRLETRLRLAQVLPSDLKPRISELTLNQLVALRFASDAELPELTRRVLTDKIGDRASIKQMIKTWEPDVLRA